jgi:hypothetical protein
MHWLGGEDVESLCTHMNKSHRHYDSRHNAFQRWIFFPDAPGHTNKVRCMLGVKSGSEWGKVHKFCSLFLF